MATTKQIARARSVSKGSKQPARKAPKPGTTATDRRLLAKAKAEAAEGAKTPAAVLSEQQAEIEEGGSGFPGKYVRAQLVKACDQLGGAIALAQQSGELETVEALTPVLATLWSTRMELGETVGGAS